MRVAVIILLVALALPSLLVLSEYNHTLRRGLFYTAWKVAEVYERINPTELYRDLSPRTRAFYRLFFLNKPAYSTLEESRANVLRSEALILPRSSVKFYPVTIRNVSAYWFEPEEYNPNNIIIYNHGGAFILGSARSEGYAAGELAHRAKARVISVNYRLLPEATLEQAIEDVVTVYKYILEEMHIKATNVIPFGCSAGGMLTLMTLQMIKTHHKNLPLPVAAATLAPGPGLEYAIDIPFLEWGSAHIPQEENIILPRELGMLVQKYVYHSHNLETDTFHENKNSHTAKELLRNFDGLPPLYVSSGELDVLRDGVIKFAELLKKENVPVDFSIQKRMIHCAASMAQFIDEGHNELDVIAQWMNDKFKN